MDRDLREVLYLKDWQVVNYKDWIAGVVELADAPDSKSGPRKWVGVQVPPPAL